MAWQVWPTPWEYRMERRESMLQRADGSHPWHEIQVRRNRVTGEKQIKQTDGEWVPYYVE